MPTEDARMSSSRGPSPTITKMKLSLLSEKLANDLIKAHDFLMCNLPTDKITADLNGA